MLNSSLSKHEINYFTTKHRVLILSSCNKKGAPPDCKIALSTWRSKILTQKILNSVKLERILALRQLLVTKTLCQTADMT